MLFGTNMKLSALKAYLGLHSSSKSPCPLLALPPELRLPIYVDVLAGSDNILIQVQSQASLTLQSGTDAINADFENIRDRRGPPALLLTCRLIAKEATEVLYEVRELYLSWPNAVSGIVFDCPRFRTEKIFISAMRKVQHLHLDVRIGALEPMICVLTLLTYLLAALETREKSPAGPRDFHLHIKCLCNGGVFDDPHLRDELTVLLHRLQKFGTVTARDFSYHAFRGKGCGNFEVLEKYHMPLLEVPFEDAVVMPRLPLHAQPPYAQPSYAQPLCVGLCQYRPSPVEVLFGWFEGLWRVVGRCLGLRK